MRLVALVEHPNHVCCRYRIEAFRPFLHSAGHELSLALRPQNVWDWLSLSRNIGTADAVVWQRKLLSSWRLSLLRRASRFLVFDVDDAVWSRDSFASKGLQSVRRQHRFAAMCRTADAVIAGNRFIVNQSALTTDRNRIHLIPTSVDIRAFTVTEHAHSRNPRLVWIGSSSTLQSLERGRTLFEAIGNTIPGVALHVICDQSIVFKNLPVVHHEWSQNTEAKQLAHGAIGISWMPDDAWSRGKCGLKLLQYMASGLPVIANSVGVHTEMIRHGENGFIADSADEWKEAIELLAADPILRRRMGTAGRRLVERHYSVESGAAHWLSLLERVGQRRQSA